MTDQAAHAEAVNASHKTLLRIGGVVLLIAALVFRRNISAEISLFGAQVPPSAAGDWFALLQSSRLLGLAFLNLFDLVNYALLGLAFLALYAALKQVNESSMKIAVSLGFVGVAVYFASNQAFSMLTLSDRYAAATTDAQRTMYLAAGEALLAINNPGAVYQGTGIYLSLLLVTLAGLMISVVMLQSGIFSKVTAYIGILAHVLVLGYYVTLVFAPTLIFIPHSAAAVPLVAWEILTALKLFQLARGIPKGVE